MATAIIPAAGLGTRVGSPPDGKELLIDPVSGRPLIDFAITAAQDAGCTRIVVAVEHGTKLLLQQYLNDTFPDVFIHQGKREGEWPSTVLQTQHHWDENNNVLILPDTRYNAQDLSTLVSRQGVLVTDVLFGLQPGKVMETDKYGIVALNDFTLRPVFTVEKPKTVAHSNIAAWGLIAFRKEAGLELFDAYAVQGKELDLTNKVTDIMYLSWFKDITRNGYVESY